MIEDIYTEALLAAAAYADWSAASSEAEKKAELINNRGFTEEQYKTFFDPLDGLYKVYGDPSTGYIELANGFSATIFEERATGDLTVAFRGTDDVADWLTTNLDVLLGGTTIEYFTRQDDSISVFLEQAGLLTGGVLAAGVNFSGHSLGGFLTTMASYKYHTTMGEGYTFNGLGVNFTDYLTNEIINGISLDGKINNYYADFVGSVVGYHPGPKTEIFIENESTLDDHSISKLVESLSVYRVLALLDPNLDTESGFNAIYKILDAATNVADQSLETIINQLGDLLGGNLAIQANKDDIELFYQEVVAADNNYNIEAVAGKHIADLAALDNEAGNGYRYALVNLLPFAITSNLAGTAVADAQYDLNDTNGDIVYTDQYLQDRSKFLSFILIRNTEDITSVPTVILSNDGSAEIFTDIKTGQEIQTFGFSPVADRIVFGDIVEADVIQGGNNNDRLYGMGGNDILNGQSGNDYIEGGTGDDTITGGKGIDTLVGGAGKDTFVFNSGDGFDIVKGGDVGGDRILLNGDELGTLSLEQVPMLASYLMNENDDHAYSDEKGNLYIHSSSDSTLKILAPNSDGSYIRIENYVAAGAGVPPESVSNFGIVLPENNNVEPILVDGFTDAFVEGSTPLYYQAFFYEADSESLAHDNVYVSNFDGNDPDNGLYYGLISTYAGDDVIAVSANPEEVNYFSSILIGGKGSDTIYGGSQGDFLIASEIYTSDGEARDDVDEENWLFGGKGEDILVGASYNDFLVSGDDEDWIYAGTGNDTLFRDTQDNGHSRNERSKVVGPDGALILEK
ncbi:MAG: hypothetical protein KBT53_11170 [Porticoccus sp.]|nr:hypothetical protein [Porticoccus sp.]MBQ0806934.1 hypothetical protein [Porticoccus sp.]